MTVQDLQRCPDGRHRWRWHDGRPAYCLACGELGHPVAASEVIDQTANRRLIDAINRQDAEAPGAEEVQ
jgi:hypothetical protein